MLIILIFLLFLQFAFINSANILIIATLPSPSHHIWVSAITTELAKREHNITVISSDFDKNPPNGVHYIVLENLYDEENRQMIKDIMRSNDDVNPFEETLLLFSFCLDFCQKQAKTEGFRTLLDYPNDFQFDLIIHDFTCGPCLIQFAHKFKKAPLLGITGYSNPSYLPTIVGGHNYYSYVPHNTLLNDDNMNFLERTQNFLLHLTEYIGREWSFIPAIDALVKDNFGPDVPSVGEIERQTSLALINTNPAMDYMAPLPENVIPVAGLHIKDPKPLPSDIKAFIDSAKKGIVIFSLGTNFRSDFLPIEKRKIFLDVFSELPDYNFLWKFESNLSASDLPRNVMVRSWLPLSNILADSKTKAIFYHGGLLTTQEAIWRGVPMIIMPFGFDQKQNLIKTKRLGISEGVNFHRLTKKDTKIALLKVLEDPSYVTNALKVSAKFRDQKEKPLDKAVWWVEWLIRNPDCEYLKSPVLRLGFIAGNAYDIIAFITLLIAIVFIVLIKVVCICKNKVCGSRNRSEQCPHKKHQ